MGVNACHLSTREARGNHGKFMVSLGYMVSVRLACAAK